MTELVVRLRQAAAARLERAGVGAAARLPADRPFLQRLGARPGDAALLLDRFRHRDVGAIFPALQDPAGTAEVVRRRWPGRVADVIARAERVHQGRFDLLGYEALDFGDPVDWQLDPVSGRRAPRRHWSALDPLDAGLVGDHKVVWELNRHQHFPLLARAWLLTGDARHVRLLLDHLAAWMGENQPKQGINWTSSLELAYRCIAWIWALNLIRASDLLDPPLLLKTLKYLWVQGRHVETHLSTYFSPNTHLTGEALGLLYLGTLVPELPDAERWRRRGWRTLVDQLDRHVLSDGTYFERASYYHRYTVDIYTHALLLGRAGGAPEGELARVEAALGRLLDHLAWLTRPDGTVPLVGDDDGGHLWFPEPGRLDDVRPALSTGAALFRRPDLAHMAPGGHEETLWLLGPAGVAVLDDLEPAPPEGHSAVFSEGGYYVFRDGWSHDASLMVVDAGPLGALNCGHAHADALAFDLTVRGRPVLVDPGTYSYADAAARDEFRSTAAHNTLVLDGVGSSEPAGPFQWRHRADAVCDRWLSGERFDLLAGHHAGFERVAPPGEHRREILFARGEWWMVRDTVRVHDPRPGALHFQLAEGIDAVVEAGALRIVDPGDGDLLYVATWRTDGQLLPGRVEPGWVSRAYGRRARAPRWVVPARPLPPVALTLLLPARSRSDVTVHAEGGGLRLAFHGDGVRHLVLVGSGDRLEGMGWRTDARWLWVRQAGAEAPMEVLAIDASNLSLNGRSLLDVAERREIIEARVERDGIHRDDRQEPGAPSEAPRSRIP
jgi:hypothetical protein